MAARFTREQLESFHGATVDDLLGPDVRLLFVGINPGLWTAAVNAHFARRGNRFWPALHAAGILPVTIDPSGGMTDADIALVQHARIGISNLVPTASARADQLTATELRDGGRKLEALVARVRPAVVAVLGLTAYRQAFDRRATTAGRQDERFGATGDFPGADLFVLPNPSGLNAHESLDSLAAAYRAAAVAAGIVEDVRPSS